MSKLSGAFGLLALGLLAVYGCSSDEKSGATAATGGSAGRATVGGQRSAGGSTANPAACPTTQPDQGDACTQLNLRCIYGNETCLCRNRGGGQAGEGGQGTNLVFTCQVNQDAGAGGAGAGTCDQGKACDPLQSTCVNADGQTCTCVLRRGEQTYLCDFGGGGAGPGTGGSANGGVAAADCAVGNECTPGTTCQGTNGRTCWCNADTSTYQGNC